MKNIICPVCRMPLEEKEKALVCSNNHCFDKAKEGYVNLLSGNHKKGSLMGDNKDMAVSRRAFLEKGYFDSLVNALTDFIEKLSLPCPQIVDICCGEGYYSHRIKQSISCDISAFDLSKEMVRLAAKRKNGNFHFVANLSSIPIETESTDVAIHLFAPFHEKEFSRIIRNDGCILSVVAGENHLFELKELLYEKPYKNDEKPPETTELELCDKIKITSKILLSSKQDIDALFKMTPYYYHTSQQDKDKLKDISSLEVTTDFLMLVYRKK